MCFPVIFVKFVRNPFHREHLRATVCEKCFNDIHASILAILAYAMIAIAGTF